MAINISGCYQFHKKNKDMTDIYLTYGVSWTHKIKKQPETLSTQTPDVPP
jgi:hypothetical protein